MEKYEGEKEKTYVRCVRVTFVCVCCVVCPKCVFVREREGARSISGDLENFKSRKKNKKKYKNNGKNTKNILIKY